MPRTAMLIKTGKAEAAKQDPCDCIQMYNFYSGKSKEEYKGKNVCSAHDR